MRWCLSRWWCREFVARRRRCRPRRMGREQVQCFTSSFRSLWFTLCKRHFIDNYNHNGFIKTMPRWAAGTAKREKYKHRCKKTSTYKRTAPTRTRPRTHSWIASTSKQQQQQQNVALWFSINKKKNQHHGPVSQSAHSHHLVLNLRTSRNLGSRFWLMVRP